MYAYIYIYNSEPSKNGKATATMAVQPQRALGPLKTNIMVCDCVI